MYFKGKAETINGFEFIPGKEYDVEFVEPYVLDPPVMACISNGEMCINIPYESMDAFWENFDPF